MKPICDLLRSFVVTFVISFTFPVMLVLGLLTIALGVSYFPGLESIGEVGVNQLLSFLRIFGAGSIWRGLMVIGLTLALVAGWFDIYSLYRMHQFKDMESKISQNS
ncbi:MAG: hypothetical protein ACLFQP_05935 [Halothece sp.]